MSGKNWQTMQGVDQDNNATEFLAAAILKTIPGAEYGRDIYRETCGPSSLEACLAALGVDQSQAGRLQPSDYYTMLLNDRTVFAHKDWPLPHNRYIESYPELIRLLYPQVKSQVLWYGVGIADLVRKVLLAPDSVAILNLKNPGHYVAAVHIDSNDVVTYNDSWLGDYFNPSPKHLRTIKLADLVANLKTGLVEIKL